MKVLIADDDLVIRHLLSSLLTGWGYEVTSVSNGKEARAALERDHSLTLAIIDWMMPDADGLEIVRRLREDSSRPYTYVLLLTAKTQKKEMLKALNAGCDDFLSKPFDADELQARLLVGKRIVNLQQQLADSLRQTRYQATHDLLTGLPNRAAVLETLNQEISRAARSHESASLSVAMLDIDHFKSINDSYGHAGGDEVLRLISERIRGYVRDYDTIGRFGGEEFLIVMPGCSAREAASVCDRICAGLASTPVPISGFNLTVTASIGVAEVDPTKDASESIHHADQALYLAKSNGRNRVECHGQDDSATYLATNENDPIALPRDSYGLPSC